MKNIRYYVCGIGYGNISCVTGEEIDFGDFDSYKEAIDCFNKAIDDTYHRTEKTTGYEIQIGKYEEDAGEINCFYIMQKEFVECV